MHKMHIKNLGIFDKAGKNKINESISAKVKVISGTCNKKTRFRIFAAGKEKDI